MKKPAAITFEVFGKPVPKQSYRHSKRGGYTPQRVKDWQEVVSFSAMIGMNRLELGMLTGNVDVTLNFRLQDRGGATLTI